MPDQLNSYNRLIEEHEVIRENASRITRLSEEFVKLTELQNSTSGLTSHQLNHVNNKCINLRHHVVNLKDGLRVHYDLEEDVMRPSLSRSLMQKLATQHERILKKLSELDALILNLSPSGVLFNIPYLKRTIDSICLIIRELSYQENSLLAIAISSR